MTLFLSTNIVFDMYFLHFSIHQPAHRKNTKTKRNMHHNNATVTIKREIFLPLMIWNLRYRNILQERFTISKINSLRRCYLNSSSSSSQVQKSLTYDRDTGIVSCVRDDSSSLQAIYRSVIGIEIHAQLAVPTKLLSIGPTKHHPDFNAQPNSSASRFDIAYPGALPQLSKSAVRGAVISAAALNCKIQNVSRFERKHYTYADLPFGYQVTQQRWPIAKDGFLRCRRYSPPAPKKKKKKKKRERRGSQSDTGQEPGDQNQIDTNTTLELSTFFDVGIDRVQMEQDTGKTTAIPLASGAGTQYRIDFNRAGSTLIEIVFRPQIHAAHEAASVVSTLQTLLKHLETCDGKMEEGSLRCDLNVSVCPVSTSVPLDFGEEREQEHIIDDESDDDNPFQEFLPEGVGHRVEVKNLNSIKQIIQSAEYEALRQTSQILDGHPTGRETRTFDPKSGMTTKIRDKGGSVDYRFMPEPDLPPVRLDESILGTDLGTFLDSMIELPEQATIRLVKEYSISEASALIITSDRTAISFYEDAVQVCIKELNDSGNQMDLKVSTTVSNWICNDLFALIKESAASNTDEADSFISVDNSTVSSTRLGQLVSLILKETVSTTQAKKLLNVMYKEDHEAAPLDIAEANGWKLISDPLILKALCKEVVTHEKNRKQFEQYQQGGKHVRKMQKFFKGKIMAESRGNAHPELMAIALDDILEELAPGVEG